MSIRIDIDTSDWDAKSIRLRSGLDNLGSRIIEEGSALVEDELRNTVPVRTGKLRASVTRFSVTDTRAQIGTSSGYGRYVNDGVGPRIIRGSPILRFVIDGVTFFRRQVFNPGFAGRHFKEKTIASAGIKIRDVIARIFKEEIL